MAAGPSAGELTIPLISNGDTAIEISDGGEDGFAGAAPLVIAGTAVPPIEMPPASAADPLVNRTASMRGAYEWFKILVCLPVVAVRLVLFGLAIAVGYLATYVALYGWAGTGMDTEPMPRWRRRIMWVTRISARCILFAFGYHWIKRKGRPAPRVIAPIVVSNHVSYIEPIYFFYELFPTIVSSESHDSIPFVGMIIRAMQVIYVDRFSPASRTYAVNEIKRKASSNAFPCVLLFPEGTTSNGRFLLSFQHGAFIPGLPVQPVIVQYPHVHFDQSWGNISLARLMFKMFTQFHNFMEVEYLPVINPPSTKHDTVAKFAEKTSYAMACALNVTQTYYSYADSLIVTRALEHAKVKGSGFLVGMAWVKDTYGVSTSEALELLEQFLNMNPDYSGRVEVHKIASYFGLCLSPTCEKMLNYFDMEKIGTITFRQFLVGSAHIRKQQWYSGACEAAFVKCCDSETLQISRTKLLKVLRPSMPCMTEDNVQKIYRFFDTNNDNEISMDDFTGCLSKYPFLLALFPDTTESGSDILEIL